MEIKKLYAIWKATFTNEKDENIPLCFNKLMEKYQGQNRYYHTLEHVSELLIQIEQYNLTFNEKKMLTLAAFFHDVIYEAGSSTNELESSVFANIWLNRLPVPYEYIHPLCEIIEATANHEAENELVQLFLDMDMQILASKEETYQWYTEQIRKEHKHLPNFFYNKGRRKFITELLMRPKIFLTRQFYTQFEAIARQNLYLELQRL